MFWIRAADLVGIVENNAVVTVWPQAMDGLTPGTSTVVGEGTQPIFIASGAFPCVRFNDPNPNTYGDPYANGAYMNFGGLGAMNLRTTGYTYFVCIRNNESNPGILTVGTQFAMWNATCSQGIEFSLSGNARVFAHALSGTKVTENIVHTVRAFNNQNWWTLALTWFLDFWFGCHWRKNPTNQESKAFGDWYVFGVRLIPNQNKLQTLYNDTYHDLTTVDYQIPNNMSVATTCVARASPDMGVFMAIDVAEIIFYPTILSDADFVRLYNILKNKYAP
jgi:hypothetical protein